VKYKDENFQNSVLPVVDGDKKRWVEDFE